jgi:hypothetical protein
VAARIADVQLKQAVIAAISLPGDVEEVSQQGNGAH